MPYRTQRRAGRRRKQSYNVKRGYGTIRLSNKEYLFDIVIPGNYVGGFIAYSIPLNPGLAGTLPWGNQLAKCYTEWKPKRWTFTYKPTCAAAVAVNTGIGIGSIMMAVQYNPQEPTFTNKPEMLNYMGGRSVAPAENMTVKISCGRKSSPLNKMFIRYAPVPADQDEKFFDIGDITIAFQGVPPPGSSTPYSIGELWTDYSITLMKPKLVFNSNTKMDSWYFTGGTATQPLGTAAIISPSGYSNIGWTIDVASQSVIAPKNLPPARYLFIWQYQGTVNSAAGTALTYPILTLSPGSYFALTPFFRNGVSPFQNIPTGGSGAGGTTQISMSWTADWIGGSASTPYILFGGAGLAFPTGSVTGNLIVIGINDSNGF